MSAGTATTGAAGGAPRPVRSSPLVVPRMCASRLMSSSLSGTLPRSQREIFDWLKLCSRANALWFVIPRALNRPRNRSPKAGKDDRAILFIDPR